jgi:hypothetical protein
LTKSAISGAIAAFVASPVLAADSKPGEDLPPRHHVLKPFRQSEDKFAKVADGLERLPRGSSRIGPQRSGNVMAG